MVALGHLPSLIVANGSQENFPAHEPGLENPAEFLWGGPFITALLALASHLSVLGLLAATFGHEVNSLWLWSW